MGELYSWFLNSARLGHKLLDAIAFSVKRWASYPAQILYNAAVAAYSSFHTGTFMQHNPMLTLNNIIGRYSGQTLKLNAPFSPEGLVDMFGGVLAPPYEARGITIGSNNIIGAYNTFSTPMTVSSNFDQIQQNIDKIASKLEYMEEKGFSKFRLQFVLGEPLIIPVN